MFRTLTFLDFLARFDHQQSSSNSSAGPIWAIPPLWSSLSMRIVCNILTSIYYAKLVQWRCATIAITRPKRCSDTSAYAEDRLARPSAPTLPINVNLCPFAGCSVACAALGRPAVPSSPAVTTALPRSATWICIWFL